MNPENIQFSLNEDGIFLHYGAVQMHICDDVDGFKIFAKLLRTQMEKIVEEIEENYEG